MFTSQVSDEDFRCSWGRLQKRPANNTVRGGFRSNANVENVNHIHNYNSVSMLFYSSNLK